MKRVSSIKQEMFFQFDGRSRSAMDEWRPVDVFQAHGGQVSLKYFV